MLTGDLIAAGVLSIIGLLIGLTLLFYLVRPLAFGLFLVRGRQALQRFHHSLEEVDALLEVGKQEEAIRLLRSSLHFAPLHDQRMVVTVREHHQNVLSRCLLIAEENGAKLDNVADIEKLIMERSELQTLNLKILQAFANFRARRAQAGKETPSWGREDFDRRLREVRDELKSNQDGLQALFTQLFKAIQSSPPEQITYH